MIFINLYKKFEFWVLSRLGFIKFGRIGEKTIIKYGVYGDCKNINIGDYVYIGEEANFWALGGIDIGSGTIVGPNVIIRSSNHDYKIGDYLPYSPEAELRKVIIGENCWIGDSVKICPGTSIGEGCIIGMGAVISGKIPNYSIVVGNPGKVIKTRNIEKYKELKSKGKIYLKNKIEGKI